MKICCIIASLRLGGAERQLAGLAAMLRRAGHDVEVITYRDGDFYASVLQDAGVENVRIPTGGGDFMIVKRIAAHLRQTGCELLISFLAGTNIKACMVKRRCPSVRLIVSERNNNRVLLPHDIFRFCMYGRAEKTVCNSHSQEAFIRKHFPPLRRRLCTVTNFADTEYFSPADGGGSNGGEVIRILVTARLDKRKNAHALIRAAAECSCPNLRFDWYGAAEESRYRHECLGLIHKYGLSGRFLIHDAAADVRELYRTADFFCLPSFYEGTPNSLAEALSCGLPAAVSDVSDNSCYVADGVNGFLFNPRDISSMSSALRRIAGTTAAQRQQFGRRSREKAEKSFEKNIFLSKWLDIIER